MRALRCSMFAAVLSMLMLVPSVQAEPVGGPRTASAVYLDYLRALRTAASLRDIYPYLAKSMAVEMQTVMSQQSPDLAKKLEEATLTMLRSSSTRAGTLPSTPTIRESSHAQNSELTVIFPSYTMKVAMVLEGGTWRVKSEDLIETTEARR